MSHELSVFILTRNSEKYLEAILMKLKKVCDDVLVVDSSSEDNTRAIAEWNRARFVTRAFDNFKNQRDFATTQCLHDWVLMVDSDEIPDDKLIQTLEQWKLTNPEMEAYRIPRTWIVLGKKVHAVYPVVSPDYPVRLFDRRKAGFTNSPVVHEEPSGYRTVGLLNGNLQHHTFETAAEIREKLERYTSLSAQTLLKKNKKTSYFQQRLSAIAAFLKWYLAKGGWKDGWTGIILGRYAYDYTFLKYAKARKLRMNR